MRKREVEDLLPLLDAEAVAARPKVEFAVGDPVRVCEGPFQSQEGTIEEIDPEKGKLRVSVSIFAAPRLWTWNTGRWKKPESSLRLPPSVPFPFIFSANKAKPWQKK